MQTELIERIRTFSESQPQQLAVTAFEPGIKSLTYREVYYQAKLLARVLGEQKKEIDCCFVISARTTGLAITITAALAANIPLAIIDHRLGLQRLATILNQTSKAIAVVDDLGARILASLSAAYPLQSDLITLAMDKIIESEIIQTSVSDCHSSVSEFSAKAPIITSQNTSIILFTSGSTGSPKGVCIATEDLTQRLKIEQDWFELTNSDTILGVLPLNFDVGLMQFLGTLWCGGHHILSNSWLPADIVNKLDQFRCNGLALSPMVWKSLLGVTGKLNIWQALNQLRYVTLSGGALPKAELDVIANHLTRCTFIKTYGQTEMFRIASMKVNESTRSHIESVGRPYPGVKLHILDDDGCRCPPGKEGQVVASGLGRMQGYFADAGMTNNTLNFSRANDLDSNDLDSNDLVSNEIDWRVWIATGDVGYLDDKGYLYLRGRKDDMLKILDQRIFPDDIARSIAEILQIKEVYVINVAKHLNVNTDQQATSIQAHNHISTDKIELAAFILMQEVNSLESDIRKKLKAHLASHLVPKHIITLDQFPVTASGKLDKQALKKYWNNTQA